MRAIGYQHSLPATEPLALQDIDLPRPSASGRDLLVQVEAVSVNPVDAKIRKRAAPEAGQWKVLGFDAAGVVVETGPDVRLFRPGDRVFYAGANNRPGSNQQFHLVDERITGPMPASLGFAEAAALPLTAITAWESLFDRLEITRPVSGAAAAIVIIGAAGGVGSIAVQLARQLSDLTVIGTASRPESADWVRKMGAHHVIDHSRPMAAQLQALGLGAPAAPAYVLSTTQTDRHIADIVALIAPMGRLALIDDPEIFDIKLLKSKCLSLHWEMMFARPLFQTPDMQAQHDLLSKVSKLVDEGRLQSTLSEVGGTINAENLRRAHAQIETGTTRGKIVLAGF